MARLHHFAAALLGASALAAPASAQRIDRIVAFGDSYADDGNFFQLVGIDPVSTKVYTTGRFSGGTNYIDSLSQLLNAPVDNFAIGGALTDNRNTNGPPLGFATEYGSFLNGGGGVFPTVSKTFDAHDLVAVSVGGNDARFYQQTGGTLANATTAADASAAAATVGLNALVGAGAQNISFLAGNTAILPEVASNPAAKEIRNTYSTRFNSAIQSTLAGYADDGVMVHYLDLTLVGQNILANPAAYGFSGVACPVFPDPTCVVSATTANQYLFYGDGLHLTSAGFAVVAKYIARQLDAPLLLQAPSDVGLDTARQFGRTLTSRLDSGAPRDGDSADGLHVFLVGDSVSRSLPNAETNDAFRSTSVGVSAGAEYGFGNGVIGIAGNYSRPRARFDNGNAKVHASTYQGGVYMGYAIAGLFAQAYAGYGHDHFRLGRAGVLDDMRASTGGNHWIAGGKAGYLIPVGPVRMGPIAALDYANGKVDSYTETGDAALTLNVRGQRNHSLRGSLGAEVRGDFGGGGVQLRPWLDVTAERDFDRAHRIISFSQTASPGIVDHFALDPTAKKIYARLAGGASAAILTNVSLDASAAATIGKQQGEETSVAVGLRVGF